MNRQGTVILDNEAVAALSDPRHPKHVVALEFVEATVGRNRDRTATLRVVVPTAVRVEAGWDRRARNAAVLNRLRIGDVGLDGAAADRAAALRTRVRVSVVDAHIGAAIGATTAPHAIVSSDVPDMRRIVDHLGVPVTVVHL